MKTLHFNMLIVIFRSMNGIFEMLGFQSVFSENFELLDQCSVDPVEG